MMDLQREKDSIMKKAAELEGFLEEMSYLEYCEPVLSLELAWRAIDEFKKHSVKTVEQIGKRQILSESKRR
jgi:hypothetical protein